MGEVFCYLGGGVQPFFFNIKIVLPPQRDQINRGRFFNPESTLTKTRTTEDREGVGPSRVRTPGSCCIGRSHGWPCLELYGRSFIWVEVPKTSTGRCFKKVMCFLDLRVWFKWKELFSLVSQRKFHELCWELIKCLSWGTSMSRGMFCQEKRPQRWVKDHQVGRNETVSGRSQTTSNDQYVLQKLAGEEKGCFGNFPRTTIDLILWIRTLCFVFCFHFKKDLSNHVLPFALGPSSGHRSSEEDFGKLLWPGCFGARGKSVSKKTK